MPCVAKHLLKGVLSMTPGNFLAEKTWKTSLKQEARTGAEAVFRVWAAVGEPTLTKFIFNLRHSQLVLGMELRSQLPERAFSPDTKILQYEPDAHLVIRVGQLKSADAKASYQIPGEHSTWVGTRVAGA
jgi:hypothetical protein